jgi:hypothetical protein
MCVVYRDSILTGSYTSMAQKVRIGRWNGSVTLELVASCDGRGERHPCSVVVFVAGARGGEEHG